MLPGNSRQKAADRLPVDHEFGISVMVLNIRIGDEILFHRWRDLILFLLDGEMDDLVHIRPEIRVAPGKTMEYLMGQDVLEIRVVGSFRDKTVQ